MIDETLMSACDLSAMVAGHFEVRSRARADIIISLRNGVAFWWSDEIRWPRILCNGWPSSVPRRVVSEPRMASLRQQAFMLGVGRGRSKYGGQFC